jgi:YfiH family protein
MALRGPSSEIEPDHGVPVLRWPAFRALGVDVAVTTRDGGTSQGPYESLNLGLHVGDDPASVIENRRRAAASVGAQLEDLVFANQVHGTTVAIVTDADRGRGTTSVDDALPDADVLITTSEEPVLVILVADCVPIVLFDPLARVLCCVHAGWRGTVARAVIKAVDAMETKGADPARIIAGIGPAIGKDNYLVGDEVAEQARELELSELHEVLQFVAPGQWRFDLPESNRLLLRESGVPPENIYVAEACTGSPGPFFSDRALRPCGRFGLLARLC